MSLIRNKEVLNFARSHNLKQKFNENWLVGRCHFIFEFETAPLRSQVVRYEHRIATVLFSAFVFEVAQKALVFLLKI